MSIRIAASADAPTRSNAAGVPAGSSALTVFVRAKLTTVSAFASLFSFGSATNEQLLQMNAAGTGLVVTSQSGVSSAAIATFAAGDSFEAASAYAGAGGTLIGYGAKRGVPFSSQSVTGGNVSGTPQFFVGTDVSAEFWNGELEDLRIWTVQLTQAELELERTSPTPVRRKDLWLWCTLDGNGNGWVDFAGNARHLSMPSTTRPGESRTPWVNRRRIPRAAKRAAAATATRHVTIKGGLPITRPSRGGATLVKPAIRGALVSGSPRDTIYGRIAITRPWRGYGQLVRPTIRGSLVSGSPREVIRGGLPITRPWVGTDRIFGHAQGGKIMPGQTTMAHGWPAPKRPWVGYGLLARAQPGGAPPATGAPRDTILGRLAITRPWVGFAIVAHPAIRGPLVPGTPRDVIRGGLPITRPWVGGADLWRPAAGSGAGVSSHKTIRAGLPITRLFPTGARLVRPARSPRAVLGRTLRAGLPLVRRWAGGALQTGALPGIIPGRPRTTMRAGLPITRAWMGTHRLFLQRPGGASPEFILARLLILQELTPTIAINELTPRVAITQLSPSVDVNELTPSIDISELTPTIHITLW